MEPKGGQLDHHGSPRIIMDSTVGRSHYTHYKNLFEEKEGDPDS